MPGLGVMVVVQQAERVLLTQREDFAVWCLPGGAAEPNEQPNLAAIREVREETGLEVRLTRLVALISRPQWGADGRLTLVFAGEPVGGTLSPDPREVLDLGFFAPAALPAPLMLEHRQMIGEALCGGAGQLWVSSRHMPAQFGDRAALYRWRDESGLSRAEAYTALTQMIGEVPLARAVPGPQQPADTRNEHAVSQGHSQND
jgi:ADP-ribose pyrophosphatase YjhB (NUDIX family)